MADGSTVYLEEPFEAVDVDIDIDIDGGDLSSWEVINPSDDDEGDNYSYDDEALDDEDKDRDCKELDSVGSPSSDLSMRSPPDQLGHLRQCKNDALVDDIRKYESNGAEYDDADRDCKKVESIGSSSSDLSMQSLQDQLGHLRQCNNRDVVDDIRKYESNGAGYDVAGRDGKEIDSIGSPSPDVSMQSLLDQLIHYPESDLAMEFLLDQIPKLRPLDDDDVYVTRKCESNGVENDDADRDCKEVDSIGSASSGLPVQAFLEQLLGLRQCNNDNVVDNIWKYESNGAEYDDPDRDCKEVYSIGSPWSDLSLQSPVDQVLRLRQCNNDDVVGDIGKHESNGEENNDDDEDDDIDEVYDLDDELVPKWVNNRFGRQRMRKFGKKAYPKMNKSKRLPYHYIRPGCVHGKHGLGLKHCLI